MAASGQVLMKTRLEGLCQAADGLTLQSASKLSDKKQQSKDSVNLPKYLRLEESSSPRQV